MKKYKRSLVVGRFQPLHIGHEAIINKALELSDNVIIFIGSADKEGTKDNPFSYETRKQMLELVYSEEIDNNKIKIYPLKDIGVGNVFAWGDYLIEEVKKYTDKIDLFVSGEEAKIDLWFNDNLKKEIDFYKLSRDEIKISATELRKIIFENEYVEFKKYTNPKLYKYYSMIRLEIIKTNVEKTNNLSYMFEDVFDEDEE